MHRFRIPLIASAVTLAFAAAALAATPHRGHFKGSTIGQGKTIKLQQDRSFRFTVAKGKVTGITVGFKATCPSGTVDSDAVPLHGSFAIKAGRFSGSGKISDGGTGTVTGHFTSARSASGTLRMQPTNVTDGVEGGNTEQCDSGPLRWTARLG